MHVATSSSVPPIRNEYTFKNFLALPKSPYKYSLLFASKPPIRCQYRVCSSHTVTQHLKPSTVDWAWGPINWPAGTLELNPLDFGCWDI